MSNDTSIIKFSINNWDHLYSLKSAIERKLQHKGGCLSIRGTIRNQVLSDTNDTPIEIKFRNLDGEPDYPENPNGQLILGVLQTQQLRLSAQLSVDDNVFNELRKNLMEYGDLDGIHIVVSIELEGTIPNDKQQTFNILDLSYAMKGDA